MPAEVELRDYGLRCAKLRRTPGADSYALYNGTSMATPHVSGVVALMLSVKPTLTPDQVTSILQSTARAFPATCSQCGAGIVNASAAVKR